MTHPRVPLALLGLLLPMMASSSSPVGRYQQATIQDRGGVPCFGVPDTSETRANVPLITGVSVMEVGTGGAPIWERDFLLTGATELPLPPGQCLTYGDGGTPAPALQSGKYYQVEMWGRTPGTPGHKGEAQSRWFSGRFCMVDVAGRAVIRTDKPDCAPTMQPGE